MEYIETLNLDDRYIFDMEDDVLKKIQKEVKRELEECEKKKMRHLKLKGDIIITDPCYIIKKRDTNNMPKYDDFFKFKNQSDYPDFDGKYSKMFLSDCERYDSAYDKWEQENPDDRDLWDDNDLSKFGINHFICHDTLYGDWSCTTINTDTNKPMGEFCADSGQVAVFLLDEVLQYNPDFNFHIEKPWTTTLIKNFDGEVFFEKIDSKTLIVRGIGNINFKTMQTEF